MDINFFFFLNWYFLDDVEQVAEGIYVINEVIRFTERLLYIGLTSCGIQTDIHLTFSALEFYLWVR